MSSKKSLNVHEVCMAIIHLTKKERGQVITACKQHGAIGDEYDSPPIKDEDENFILFYTTLSDILLNINGTKLPKQIHYLRPISRGRLKKGWGAIDVLAKNVLPKAGSATLVSFYHIVLLTIIERLHELGIPVAIKTISYQLENCGALMDHQFPGYMASGIASLIIKWGRQGIEKDEGEL